MKSIHIQYFKTGFGELVLGSFDAKLCLCDWLFRKNRELIDSRILTGLNAAFKESESDVIILAISQLTEYFQGRRKKFDVPLLLVGTEFQKKVWKALLKIPYGQTETYAQLSERLNNSLGIRAIASANGANALSIFVPCHRIIGSDGKMVGYAGGIKVKEKLLFLEQSLAGQQLELF
jgi:methylated-DNA-[protein]-cysteine S-methyltransferase